MWTENKTSTLERTKEFIPWTSIKEERAIFDAKIMASNELSEKEKIAFIKDLSEIPDSEFRETHNLITKNYKNVISTIQMVWSMIDIEEEFKEINNLITDLKLYTHKSIKTEEENTVRINEKIEANNLLSDNSIIF